MSDEADIIATFRRDIDTIMGLFADDDDITFWGSALPEEAVGREDLRGVLSRLFDAIPTSSFHLAYSARRVNVIGDVAWVNAAGTGTWDPGDGTIHEVPYRITAVLVRRAEGWRWHTHQASQPTPLDL